MRVVRALPTLLIVSGLVLASGTASALAVCNDPLGGFAIFQCANPAYFAPQTASGTPISIAFDPNNRPRHEQRRRSAPERQFVSVDRAVKAARPR